MTTKKLETTGSWQHLDLTDAKYLYGKEFPFEQHTKFLKAFEGIAYTGRAAGYDYASKGIVITGSLIADRNISAALIAEKIKEKPGEGKDAAYSLAIFLKMTTISNDGAADGERLHRSSLFEDMDDIAEGKRIRLGEPCPLDNEFAGSAIGATISCMYKVTEGSADKSITVQAKVNDPLLEEVAMMLKRQLHDRLILLRTY